MELRLHTRPSDKIFDEYSIHDRRIKLFEGDSTHDRRIKLFDGDFRSQTCKCKKGSDWLKRWVEAQHNIFKL